VEDAIVKKPAAKSKVSARKIVPKAGAIKNTALKKKVSVKKTS